MRRNRQEKKNRSQNQGIDPGSFLGGIYRFGWKIIPLLLKHLLKRFKCRILVHARAPLLMPGIYAWFTIPSIKGH